MMPGPLMARRAGASISTTWGLRRSKTRFATPIGMFAASIGMFVPGIRRLTGTMDMSVVNRCMFGAAICMLAMEIALFEAATGVFAVNRCLFAAAVGIFAAAIDMFVAAILMFVSHMGLFTVTIGLFGMDMGLFETTMDMLAMNTGMFAPTIGLFAVDIGMSGQSTLQASVAVPFDGPDSGTSGTTATLRRLSTAKLVPNSRWVMRISATLATPNPAVARSARRISPAGPATSPATHPLPRCARG
jgi:hypothetical protein